MNKKIIGIVAIIAVLMAVLLYKYSTDQSDTENIADQQENANQDQIVGDDKDEHGCILTAGYSWCDAKQKCLRPWEEGCEDYITQLFRAIKEKTEIDFSEPNNIELVWQVESEEGIKDLALQALMISANTVANEDFQKIKTVIENDGFEKDKYNARGGIFGEFDAYRKDNFGLVCTLSGIASDFDPDNPKYEPQTTDKDVKITCAILDKALVPEISTEKRIREALAAKHNKKVSQTEITIVQETENHARGNVVFQPGGSENSGMFLAAKINNEWQIVFDGNGSISCKELEIYNFPENITEDVCY